MVIFLKSKERKRKEEIKRKKKKGGGEGVEEEGPTQLGGRGVQFCFLLGHSSQFMLQLTCSLVVLVSQALQLLCTHVSKTINQMINYDAHLLCLFKL